MSSESVFELKRANVPDFNGVVVEDDLVVVVVVVVCSLMALFQIDDNFPVAVVYLNDISDNYYYCY